MINIYSIRYCPKDSETANRDITNDSPSFVQTSEIL